MNSNFYFATADFIMVNNIAAACVLALRLFRRARRAEPRLLQSAGPHFSAPLLPIIKRRTGTSLARNLMRPSG